MTVHQCPKCELRFTWKTELDDHCREDHPGFRHEYPGHAWELKHAQDRDPQQAVKLPK
jgi:hypothetical protein